MPPRVPPRQWRVRLAFPAASFAGGRVLSGTSPTAAAREWSRPIRTDTREAPA